MRRLAKSLSPHEAHPQGQFLILHPEDARRKAKPARRQKRW
jgi:hypothetical protein